MPKKLRGCRDSSGDFIPTPYCRGIKSYGRKHNKKSLPKKHRSRPRRKGFWKSLFR